MCGGGEECIFVCLSKQNIQNDAPLVLCLKTKKNHQSSLYIDVVKVDPNK